MRTGRAGGAAGLALILAMGGCASINTFVSETGDLTSGRTEQAVGAAQQRQDVAKIENTSLHTQLAQQQAQRDALQGQLGAAQAQLGAVNRKLAGASGATQAQRDEYNRLVQKQRDLQHRLAVETMAPPVADPAAAAAAKARLDALTAEKDTLARQVDALQKAL
jgi:chromosome segregation ATPase